MLSHDENGHMIMNPPLWPSPPPRSLSKNEGLVDNPEVKEWFCNELTKIMANRETPLNLIIENSPGKKWHPNDRPPPPVRDD